MKLISKNIKTIIILVMSLSWTSCGEWLDVVPTNIAVIEDAFETRDNAERFLASLYGYLPPFENPTANPALAAGDEIAVNDNVAREWDSRAIARGGQTVVSPKLGFWGNSGTVRNLFVALRDCNIFLENLDKPFDLTAIEKARWTAEAKFLKAYFHFYLMRMYGPIPIVRENIDVGSGIEGVRVSRDPVDDVTDYIVELLDEAIPDLPLVVEDRAAELGRITAPIAAAIKARVLATVASPLFNGNEDYANFIDKDGQQLINPVFDAEKWTRAADACKEAIDLAHQAGHSLYTFSNAPSDWSDTTVTELSIRGSLTEPWNPEVIWGLSNSAVTTLQAWSQAMIAPGLTAESRESVQQFWAPTMTIAEMFYTENGVPMNEDVNYKYDNRYKVAIADAAHQHYVRPGFETAILNLNREPRFYASLAFDGNVWFGHGQISDDSPYLVEAKKAQRAGVQDASRWSLSGYFAKKLIYYENVQQISQFSYSITRYPFPVVRLAGLYLLYAEALNESDKMGEAYEWIDKVRARAGLDGVEQSWANASSNPGKPSTKEGLRDIIQQERMIELVFEGQRFWDLRRWKRASDFLNRDIMAWNVEGKTTADYYNVISVGSYRFLNRDYLWPIAESDMVTNSNLIQNPGW